MRISIHYKTFQVLADCTPRTDLQKQFHAFSAEALKAWKGKPDSESICRFMRPFTINGNQTLRFFTVRMHSSNNCLIIA